MPKPKAQKFYAVKDGRETGVFMTWDECDARTKGYPGAEFKSFTNAAEAESFVSGSTYIVPPASTSKVFSSSLSTSDKEGKNRAMQEDVLDECDVVYTDGACKGNGRSGNIAERCPGDQTNNRAELIVGRLSYEHWKRLLKVISPFSSKLTLNIASIVHCLLFLLELGSTLAPLGLNDWLPNWSKNNFKNAEGDPVKNLSVIQYLDTLLQVRRQFGQSVSLQYVKGHSNDTGNDGADAQANLGALLAATPERDWASAVRDAKKQAEEDLRKGGEKPIEAPLQIVSDGIAPRRLAHIVHTESV
ncbi:hypothetical protein H0H81_003062 [Sphagnurus paluster]|uniref:Ribonuclease H n=1 Tax=Sphagnurus paluster TaxID=117069 RepID=A0A9P7KKA2_9AGAR|nr:hypothetical protein H0H81_003062 [Sphagnurus paluster]